MDNDCSHFYFSVFGVGDFSVKQYYILYDIVFQYMLQLLVIYIVKHAIKFLTHENKTTMKWCWYLEPRPLSTRKLKLFTECKGRVFFFSFHETTIPMAKLVPVISDLLYKLCSDAPNPLIQVTRIRGQITHPLSNRCICNFLQKDEVRPITVQIWIEVNEIRL